MSTNTKQIMADLLQAVKDGSAFELSADFVRSRLTGEMNPAVKWSFSNYLIAATTYHVKNRDHGNCPAFWVGNFSYWIRKGRVPQKATGFSILAPGKMRVFKTVDKETGEEIKIRYPVTFRLVTEFLYQDTVPMSDGQLEYWRKKKETSSYWKKKGYKIQAGWEPPTSKDFEPETLPELREVADRLGVTVEYGPAYGAEYGYYSHSGTIHLSSHDKPIYWHELAHAVDDHLGTLTKGYGQQLDNEVVAEYSAAVIAKMYGIDHTQLAVKYMSMYADAHKEKLDTMMLKVFKRVERILEYIFEPAKELTTV